MEYTIIEGGDKQTVIQAVNEHLKDGWELSGNLAITAIDSPSNRQSIHYFQAMIKKDKKEFLHG